MPWHTTNAYANANAHDAQHATYFFYNPTYKTDTDDKSENFHPTTARTSGEYHPTEKSLFFFTSYNAKEEGGRFHTPLLSRDEPVANPFQGS